MKRLIAAVSFAALAAPALAANGLPYEQYVVDRALPNLQERAASSGDTANAATKADNKSPWADDFNFIAPAK